jgi:hypothetical protein
MKYLHEDLEHILVRLFGKNILQILFKKYNVIRIKTEERDFDKEFFEFFTKG